MENSSRCFLVTLSQFQFSQLKGVSIGAPVLKSRVRSHVVLAFTQISLICAYYGRVGWNSMVLWFITVDILHFTWSFAYF
jgi:hypothetical protein